MSNEVPQNRHQSAVRPRRVAVKNLPPQPILNFAQSLAQLLIPQWKEIDDKYFDQGRVTKKADDLEKREQARAVIEAVVEALDNGRINAEIRFSAAHRHQLDVWASRKAKEMEVRLTSSGDSDQAFGLYLSGEYEIHEIDFPLFIKNFEPYFWRSVEINWNNGTISYDWFDLTLNNVPVAICLPSEALKAFCSIEPAVDIVDLRMGSHRNIALRLSLTACAWRYIAHRTRISKLVELPELKNYLIDFARMRKWVVLQSDDVTSDNDCAADVFAVTPDTIRKYAEQVLSQFEEDKLDASIISPLK